MTRATAGLLAALALVACDSGDAGGPARDGGGPTGPDAEPAPDADPPPLDRDAARPVGDAAPPPDAAPDASPDPDAASPNDAAPPAPDAEPPADAAPPPPPEARPAFAFPVHPEDRRLILDQPVFGVDHDPETYRGLERHRCRNYAGASFPGCYDGHDGTDFMLRGGFAVMDAGSARVVAAAGGVVTATADGHYDRCHANLASQDIDCDGHPMGSNSVRLRHANGWETQYHHLKRDSVAVQVGDAVPCGGVLGLVGSSGNSSAPHLHFEVHDPSGASWDPYAGPESQPESLWVEQTADDRLPGGACDPAWARVP